MSKALSDSSATIIISFRERWRFTPRTVESILENTVGAFELWVLDSGMPEAMRRNLQRFEDQGRLRIIDVSRADQPNIVRGKIAAEIKTPYAVFIDNDVVVMPGWLDRMIACAEETGAGIVCPLYLWGAGEQSDLIHMAGGDITLEPTSGGARRFTESHRHVSRRTSEVPDDLHRRACDYGEFHCLLMRREVYSATGMFDPGIVTVHEHIHASMLARELGFETWFEPESRVNYLAFAPWQIGELHDLRARWDFATAEQSLEAFAKRWNIVDEEDYRVPMHRFLALHASHTDVIDPRPALAANRDRVMTRGDLQQTFGGLQWLALTTGYDRKDVGVLRRGYRLAMRLVRGIYRPCGRPFINHLSGTASVLLFYGCPMPHVVAALLHAAYSHGPKGLAGRMLADFTKYGPNAEAAVAMIEPYDNRAAVMGAVDAAGDDFSGLPLELASLALLDAANDVDMHLSLEVAVSGRGDTLEGVRLEQYQKLLDHVGLPGLAATLRAVHAEDTSMVNIPYQPDLRFSFRLPTKQNPRGAPGPNPRRLAQPSEA